MTTALVLTALIAVEPAAPVLAAEARSRASQPAASPSLAPRSVVDLKLPPRLSGVELGLLKGAAEARAAAGAPGAAAEAVAAARAQAAARASDAPPAGEGAAGPDALTEGLPVPADLKLFLSRAGRDPIETDLAGLPAALAANPDYAAELARTGRARLVGLNAAQRTAVVAALSAAGVTPAAIQAEAAPPQPRAATAEGPAAGKSGSALLAPLRELSYVGRVLAASATKPTRAEAIGGLLTKGPAFTFGVLYWSGLFLPAHPVAFGIVAGLLLAVEAFHGVWINTWQNVQNIIGRQRGPLYQTAFNLIYMQGSAALFRAISYVTGVAQIAPWHAAYWRDMGLITVVGTFSGVLGYNGLNDLYNNGRISRTARSWIQQGRDFFFLIQGNFFAVGMMKGFWPIFLASVAVDLSLYAASRLLAARPALYAAPAATAAGEGFKALYPVTPGPRPSPLRQAADAVLDIFSPIAAGAKALWRAASGGRR